MAQPTPSPTNSPPPQTSNVSPLPTPSRPQGELNALLGKGSQFEGKLIFEGTVRIDGKFAGEIVSTDVLIIGEGAEVKANVQVGGLVCLGDYSGDARASKSIELKAPAKVRGNLTTASIVIERGVFFDGTCKMDTNGTNAPPAKK
ncbi:MAG TPA: polymer-forming cytoskeletal protein [Myxococcales bacterium]|jgi:cytoskeletal protein CcmA (bactofilin family)